MPTLIFLYIVLCSLKQFIYFSIISTLLFWQFQCSIHEQMDVYEKNALFQLVMVTARRPSGDRKVRDQTKLHGTVVDSVSQMKYAKSLIRSLKC